MIEGAAQSPPLSKEIDIFSSSRFESTVEFAHEKCG
jgi:hypothetical protein